MRKFLIAVSILALVACGRSTEPREPTLEEINKRLAEVKGRLDEQKRQAEEQDKRDYPFNSTMDVGSLSAAEKKRLCGNDHHQIAIGWPIRKALACSGDGRFRLVSETAGGIRIWQDCIAGLPICLTVGEQDGRVASWNR